MLMLILIPTNLPPIAKSRYLDTDLLNLIFGGEIQNLVSFFLSLYIYKRFQTLLNAYVLGFFFFFFKSVLFVYKAYATFTYWNNYKLLSLCLYVFFE